ncbi:MAG: response regulator, partial [Candidatus Eremiobacteraeota bacterium]|nr:response regulator [Candidatus Eremiobacteraeota bacterium]
VDDGYENRLLVRTVLQHAGYSVFEASDAQEALNNLREHSPDLCLVDLSLPGTSGAELIRTVRAEAAFGKLPIALYTATEINAAMRDFLNLYAIEHVIPKPCEPTLLLETVAAAFA